jgi:hypothetical protein
MEALHIFHKGDLGNSLPRLNINVDYPHLPLPPIRTLFGDLLSNDEYLNPDSEARFLL